MKNKKDHFLQLENNVGLFRHVDAVKELPDILVWALARALDTCSGEGNGLNLTSGDLDLVLHVLGEEEGDTFVCVDGTDDLLAEVVSDVNGTVLAVVAIAEGQVNWEMGVDGSHLVQKANGDTKHHVLDVGADGSHRGEFLTVGEPSINTQLLWANHSHLELEVTESSLKFCALAIMARSSHDNMSLVDRACCAFDDVEEVGRQDSLHGF